jgi:hypothetical protein
MESVSTSLAFGTGWVKNPRDIVPGRKKPNEINELTFFKSPIESIG